MPKKRTPHETWQVNIRPLVWRRDNKRCVRCNIKVALKDCHIDHIVAGLKGNNKTQNLRTLCRKCHVLREDFYHRGMIANALKDGIISADWREHVWRD